MTAINQMCRACLTTKDTFRYILFENVSGEDFCFCTSIEVQENEELPKTICDICYDLLTKYSEFKKTCIESQNTLQTLKASLKNASGESQYCGNIDEVLFTTHNSKKNIDIDVCEDVKLEDGTDQLADEIEEENQLITENNEDVEEVMELDNAFQYEASLSNAVTETDYHFEEIGGNNAFTATTSDLLQEVDFSDETILNNDIKPNKRKSKKLKSLRGPKRKEVKLKLPRKHFMYTCDLCHKKFNYRERFEAHKLEHEGKTTSIVCLPCNKTFMTWSGLRRHNENEHTKISLEKLKCPVCGKLSKSRQTLKSHEKIHGERSLLVCDVCGKGFTTAVILKTHLETHKENRERRFTCEQCGKKFFTQSILLSHVSRRHTGRRYICQICSYPFTDKYNLAKHLLIHEGKKLHKCDVCDKSYATHSSLVEHKRIHSGERPFSCSYCPKCFISKKGLNEHVRTHTGERPYKCGVCEQGFSQSGSLRRHLKIHDRMVTTLT